MVKIYLLLTYRELSVTCIDPAKDNRGRSDAVADPTSTLCNDKEEESLWHLFIWAILSNEKEIAEYFLCKTGSIIGKTFPLHCWIIVINVTFVTFLQ